MASKRKGRPLLAAAAGVAFVSFASCQQYDKPVGNLRAPEPPPSAGTGSDPSPAPTATIATSGGSGGNAPTSGGAGGGVTTPPDGPPIMPVGNLRPPETVQEPTPTPTPSTTGTPKKPVKPQPVGNLRPPSDH